MGSMGSMGRPNVVQERPLKVALSSQLDYLLLPRPTSSFCRRRQGEHYDLPARSLLDHLRHELLNPAQTSKYMIEYKSSRRLRSPLRYFCIRTYYIPTGTSSMADRRIPGMNYYNPSLKKAGVPVQYLSLSMQGVLNVGLSQSITPALSTVWSAKTYKQPFHFWSFLYVELDVENSTRVLMVALWHSR